MRFSIITPTLQRESLIKCCESVDSQTFTDWEHIIAIDCDECNRELLKKIAWPHRMIYQCVPAHHNFGNRCRHEAWDFATGEYCLYLDDDNFLADTKILEDISESLKDNPEWGLFPMLRHGQWFYTDPPRSCHVDTANIVVKREIGRWPEGPQYTMDGIWVDALVLDHPSYQAFPNFRPIIVMPTSNEGR